MNNTIVYNQLWSQIVEQDLLLCDVISDQHWARVFSINEWKKLTYLLICENSHIDLKINCEWEGSQADIFCIFLARGNTKISGKCEATLSANSTSTNIYMLSLLTTNSDIDMDWSVVIAPDIIKASGHLLEENLILGGKVKIKTLPMLDVRSNDVSASHGCRIDRVNAEKLFYMTSKGIPTSQANHLIVQGYVINVLEKFSPLWAENIEKLEKMIIEKII